MTEDIKLLVDLVRLTDPELRGTGIYVKAWDGERWGAFDIMHLERDSLLAWLRSRQDVVLPERTVLMLLGYPR